MRLLSYRVEFDESGCPTVRKRVAGRDDTEVLFESPEAVEEANRTKEGLKLETAYRILEDYKDLQTSEKYLEEFVERFLDEKSAPREVEIMPSEIEEWLDRELDADESDITGQKWDG